MIEEFIKALEEQERQAAMSHEHMVICEEHLAEQITKGVDECPLDEYRSDVLMRALDTALDNLEIDKATFIKGWSRPLTIGFTAALSTIIEMAFDNPEDRKMIATLLYREFGGER